MRRVAPSPLAAVSSGVSNRLLSILAVTMRLLLVLGAGAAAIAAQANGGSFRIAGVVCSWAEWKEQTGFDARSVHAAARPTGVNAFVRPNFYEADRANLVVYNWQKSEKVAVDLGDFLAVGEDYTIVDAQNYWGPPVVTGRHDGARVTIPMNLTAVAPIIGESLVPNVHTSAEFGAFVIRKTKPAPSRSPTVSSP